MNSNKKKSNYYPLRRLEARLARREARRRNRRGDAPRREKEWR